jgi:hypothetical protein
MRGTFPAVEIAAFVLSLIAVGIAAVAARYARRGALASEDSARESTRSADAAQEVVSYQRDEVERNRLVFVLRRTTSDDTYVLQNAGTDFAYGVHVDVGDMIVDADATDYDEFPPGHSEEYMLLFHLGTETTHMTVTWHQQADRSDEERQVRLYVEH